MVAAYGRAMVNAPEEFVGNYAGYYDGSVQWLQPVPVDFATTQDPRYRFGHYQEDQY